MLARIQAALAIGSANPDVVAVQARHTAASPGTGAVLALPARIGPDPRPVPSLAAYDQLLTHPTAHTPTPPNPAVDTAAEPKTQTGEAGS